jgi:uncharacterized membrane protein (UPF0136 family)
MAWITLAYAIIILVGGVVGHVLSGSSASLIAGIAFGLLLLLSAWALFRGMRMGPYGLCYSLLHSMGFLPTDLSSQRSGFPRAYSASIACSLFCLLPIFFEKSSRGEPLRHHLPVNIFKKGSNIFIFFESILGHIGVLKNVHHQQRNPSCQMP